MPFVTYENTHNPHVTIHVDGCGQVRKRGGQHVHDQGRYYDHPSYNAARAHAEGTGLPLRDCSFCTPRAHP
jgi:hypothetical protein